MRQDLVDPARSAPARETPKAPTYELGPQELAADHTEELFGHCGGLLCLPVGRAEVECACLRFGVQVFAEPVEEGFAVDGEAGGESAAGRSR
ncbi:hypothetical protein [Streptomyces ossamyceticus]|uniref:hypothetical protein n=1 Tax=Streptomyces ossamyceticus TaxID=249581 RepID=UPI0012FF06AA|nr:hypothetical protein [Streptomyces ossamyceticus]